MGLSNAALVKHKEQTEHKLEDKLQALPKANATMDKDEYDFENAQIEDLGEFIGGVGGKPADQEKLLKVLQKRIANIDAQLESSTKQGKIDSADKPQQEYPIHEDIIDDDVSQSNGKVKFIKKRDRKTLNKQAIQQSKTTQIDQKPDKSIIKSKIKEQPQLSFAADDDY